MWESWDFIANLGVSKDWVQEKRYTEQERTNIAHFWQDTWEQTFAFVSILINLQTCPKLLRVNRLGAGKDGVGENVENFCKKNKFLCADFAALECFVHSFQNILEQTIAFVSLSINLQTWPKIFGCQQIERRKRWCRRKRWKLSLKGTFSVRWFCCFLNFCAVLSRYLETDLCICVNLNQFADMLFGCQRKRWR